MNNEKDMVVVSRKELRTTVEAAFEPINARMENINASIARMEISMAKMKGKMDMTNTLLFVIVGSIVVTALGVVAAITASLWLQ